MKMIVFDTDILIDHFHGSNKATALIRELLLERETLIISVVTVTEILAGMRQGEKEKTEALLSLFGVHNVDERLACVAGAYLNQFATDQKLDLGDALIAATTQRIGGVLYTRNTRHYPMKDISVKVPYTRGSK